MSSVDDPTPLSSPMTAPSVDGGATALLERELVEQPVEPGDHERFAHYVRKEKIVESAVTGMPVIALCGKVWVPGRDPSKFPVCPMCKEIYEQLPRGGGDGKGSGADKGSGSGSGSGGDA
ncbi:MAG: DUF3039 domain-containing protein [Kineosporiaceae bacterium]|nr:DUF3039 domain-containing protein [Kineosporiaceae bacterium]